MNLCEEKCKNNFFRILPIVNWGLSFLIVIHHSFNIDIDFNASIKSCAWAVERYLYNLSECAVPVFFFISAMLFYRNYVNDKSTYLTKVKKRIVSLIIPYTLFNILGYIKHVLFSGSIFSFWGLLKSICISDTMPLWFLRELFVLVLLAPIISLIKQKKILMLLIWGVVFILISLGVVKYRTFIYWLPIYMLGAVCTPNVFMKIRNKINKNWAFLFGTVYLIFAWFLPNTSRVEMDFCGNILFYIFRCCSVFIWILLISYIMEKDVKEYAFMNYSFWVYCVHFPIISLFSIIINRFFPVDNPVFEILKYLFTVVIVYVICVCVGGTIKRLCPSIWKILNGGRK